MSTTALVKDLVEVNISLDAIYLDPNNPRFVAQNWTYVPDEEVVDEAIQSETRLRMVREFGVEKLKMNMEINGYLPIDRVIIREFADGKFVVLEGNRRICAAKLISQYSADGTVVSDEVRASLKMIPCLQYIGGETDAAWIFQGLRHITGVSDWSAFNKAKLLVEQMDEEGLTLTEVGKRFGLTPYGAGQWVRGYYAFKQAREESDFVSEVDEKAYPYFQELFSRSSAQVREWLEWDEDSRKFKNAINFNEFVNWLYPRTLTDEEIEVDDERENDIRGDFEKRILKSRDDIRQIAFLLRDDKPIFEKFRRELDVERAYSEAVAKKYEREAREAVDKVEEVFRAISECANVLDNVPHKLLKDPTAKSKLFKAIGKLEKAINEVRQ
jgi:hypothetical protein